MKTILMIEDNKADQFLNKAVIKSQKENTEIIIASDGHEAMEILQNEKIEPDIILLDINMPRMNGHEFLQAFTDNNKKEVPVVVMLTSSDQEDDKTKAFSYKCVKDYLLKPIKAETITHLEEIVANVSKG